VKIISTVKINLTSEINSTIENDLIVEINSTVLIIENNLHIVILNNCIRSTYEVN
ncbi:5904_t:CDS:1, partial [Scutellospora calospora]